VYPSLGVGIGRWLVPIDYPEPADEPEIPRHPDCAPRPDDSPSHAITRPPSDPAEFEAVHCKYRALVQCSDGGGDGAAAASGSWDQTATGFRAEWSEYEERHPEQERPAPETHPDGSWSSGDSRRLTPGQNLEASEACAEIHEQGERLILPAMQRVEAANPDRHLAGLENMLKKDDRIKEKIADRLRYNPDLAPGQAAAEVPDAVRFTLEYSEADYTAGVLADVDRIKAEGCELLKLKNLWAKEQYKGVNTQWLGPETGVRFEVQFHTPESHEAKELTHKAYERLRDPLTSKAEERELEGFQRRVNASLRLPPDVFEIEDYPPEKRDG
jgi:hypothetical protein